MMDTDERLQQKSKALLHRLKVKQGALQKLVGVESLRQPSPQADVDKNRVSINNYDTSSVGSDKESWQKAKEQLSSKSKLPQGLMGDSFLAYPSQTQKTKGSNQINHDVETRKAGAVGKVSAETIDVDETDVLKSWKCNEGPETPISVKLAFNTTSKTPITPNSVTKRRRIIDRNIRVESENAAIDDDDFLNSSRHLNYSYSQFNDSPVNPDARYDANVARVSEESRNRDKTVRSGNQESYVEKLTSGGNNKKKASFIRDTTILPKSILYSSGPHGPKKRNGTNGTVSFRESTRSGRSSPSFLEDTTSKQLLGYDWIAGLIDNDPTIINQSEAFFDELRDFRRVNRDECENKSYMEGPLSITRSSEQSAVKEALETKVKPFTINERLFTVPVQNGWMADAVGEATDDTVENKEPSYEAPRFVRVSIPRSTLLSPHRVKPHRRRSFDPTDTMSLGEHCLMGWDSSRPAVMPAASNVALKDASRGVKTKIATTLEEAEKIASSFYWPNSAPPPAMGSTNHRLAQDSIMQLRYASLQNRSQIQERLEQSGLANKSASFRQTNPTTDLSVTGGNKQFSCFPPGGRNQSSSLDKSCTDQLLDTTYSLMYELERLRQDADTRLQTDVSVH